jgi:hypothetical protein
MKQTTEGLKRFIFTLSNKSRCYRLNAGDVRDNSYKDSKILKAFSISSNSSRAAMYFVLVSS